MTLSLKIYYYFVFYEKKWKGSETILLALVYTVIETT